MLRKLFLGLLAASAAFLSHSEAWAIDNAACCLPTTSKLDQLMNPIRGGDEKFFARAGGPPNVLFIIDTSGSMDAWPKAWPSTKGCADPFLSGLGYDPGTVYPRMYTGVNQQSSNWFATNTYYLVNEDSSGKHVGYGTDFGGSPDSTTWSNTTDACSAMPSEDQSACRSCLDTEGYYVQSATVQRVKGNFLNFYAPRDSGATKVLNEVIRDLREVRFGVMGFSMKSDQERDCWGYMRWGNWSSSQRYMCLLEPMGPACDKSYPLDHSATENNRNRVLNAITNTGGSNGFGWGTSTPLADALYAGGYLMFNKSGTRPDAVFASAPSTSSAAFAASDGVCFACGFNAIILLTDGEPSGEQLVTGIPAEIRNQTATCPGCSTDLSTGAEALSPKVAKWLWENDIRKDLTGQQRIATYTIGFSEDANDSAVLKQTAKLGGGKFHGARSTSELKAAILNILDDINARNTSFSSAAVSTLQVQGSQLTAVIPRLLPAKSDPWKGELYRLEQYNEFVEDTDRNNDGDKADIFLIDKESSIVAENNNGDYYKVTVADAGTDAGSTLSSTPAKPYWEANDELVKLTHSGRKIWTVLDGSGTGSATKDNALTASDGLVEFSVANLDRLMPYMGIGGAPLCPTYASPITDTGTLIQKMGMSIADAISLLPAGSGVPATLSSQTDADRLCAALVIQYLRGQDLFNETTGSSAAAADGGTDAGTTALSFLDDRRDTRASVLGDIFHSSPIVVTPPVDSYFCELGISNQCVRTLYAASGYENTNTEMKPDSTLATSCNISTPLTRTAYDAYVFANRKRERLILVGANDGMLHAFADGQGTEDATTCELRYLSSNSTGVERWAFIPPDFLSRLQSMVDGHHYFVDGDIMVRDIWADADGDGKKSRSEYHTIAVVAEGRGGTHYFSLELLWNENSSIAGTAKDRPGFRWMFPQACSPEASRFGKTMLSLSPKPPPIGPVLLEKTTGVERLGVNTEERWVAMLSGGWSPGGERGRGVYMVDVWNGQVNSRGDNLLWKWEFDPGATSDGEASKAALVQGVVAPIAMVDYGNPVAPAFDGFFDTAVVGDLAGQVWTFRFYKPGVLDPNTNLVKNWSGGRAFQMDKDGVDLGDVKSVQDRGGFHYLASTAIQEENGVLRAMLGTGNRYSLLDGQGGTCRFDNPSACARQSCDNTDVTYKLTRGTDVMKQETHWTEQRFDSAARTDFSAAPTDFCGTTTSPLLVKAEFTERRADSCPNPAGGGNLSYDFAKTKVTCGYNASGVYDCRVTDAGNVLNMNDIAVSTPSTLLDGLGRDRFYGVVVYGQDGTRYDRTFDEDPAGSGNRAKQFDAGRYTDRSTGGTGDLVDVTDVTCNASGVCSCATGGTCRAASAGGPIATSTDKGWFFQYSALDQKTATGSSVLASCVLWNTVYPGNVTSACNAAEATKARFVQAELISGAPNCAYGFKTATGYDRYQERSVLAPPPEPATAIQINKVTKKVKYSSLLVEPGKGQATEVNVTGNTDILQSVYELPVSQALHECRHENAADCVPQGP